MDDREEPVFRHRRLGLLGIQQGHHRGQALGHLPQAVVEQVDLSAVLLARLAPVITHSPAPALERLPSHQAAASDQTRWVVVISTHTSTSVEAFGSQPAQV